jgi:RHS repeat-associated protein
MATTVVERFAADGVTVAERESTSFDYDHTGMRVTAHNILERLDSDTGELTIRHELDTAYLVDHQNFTGYQQVLREETRDVNTGYMVREVVYTLGHDIVSQWSYGVISSYLPDYEEGSEPSEFINTATGSHLFLYDCHGSVRAIAPRGRYWEVAIDKAFTYDAYGNALGFNPTFAGTVILSRGEQFDFRIGLGYNRARYVDFWTGTWKTKDPFAGNMQDPQSLHKYAYVHGDPVNGIDPRGWGLVSTSISLSIGFGIRALKVSAGTTILSGIAGAGLYSFVFNDSPIKGAIVGTQTGAALSVAWNRGLSPQQKQKNLLETTGQGLIGGLTRIIGKAINYAIDSQANPNREVPDTAKWTQYFVEGFADAVWAYEFSNYLEDWVGADDDLKIVAQFVHSLLKSSLTEVAKIAEDGQVTWDEVVEGTKNALLGTATGFVSSKFVGNAVGNDPLIAAAYKSAVLPGINAGIDATVELMETIRGFNK